MENSNLDLSQGKISGKAKSGRYLNAQSQGYFWGQDLEESNDY